MSGIRYLLGLLVCVLLLSTTSCRKQQELGRSGYLSHKEKRSWGSGHTTKNKSFFGSSSRKGYIGGTASASSTKGSNYLVIGESTKGRARRERRKEKHQKAKYKHYKSKGWFQINSGTPNVSRVKRASKPEEKDRKKSMKRTHKGLFKHK